MVRRSSSLVLVACLAAGAWAQEPGEGPPGDDVRRRLEELERRVAEQDREIEELREQPAPSGPTAPPPDPQAPPPAVPAFEWGWKDGVFVRGTVNDVPYELRPIARIQLDYRVFARNDPNAQVPHSVPENQFLVRRARIGFSGTISDFGFVFEVDPTRSNLPLGVFSFQWQALEEVRLRLGHNRAPFALENGMIGTNQLPWLERSMAIGSGNALAPGFSPGAMVLGSFAKTFSYYLSAQNRTDSNNQVTSDPLLSARVQLDLAGGFALGASGLWVRQGGDPHDSMTGFTPAQYRFFAPVQIQGHDWRGGVDVSFFHGPWFVMAEYAYGEQERRDSVAGGGDGSPFAVQGFYVGGGWVFWGPSRGQPHGRPFQSWSLLPDLDRPRLGRFAGAELVARVEWIDLDDRNGGRGTSAPSRAPDAADILGCDARALTVGLNVFPIENVRLSVHWSHVRVSDQGRAPDDGSRYNEEVVLRGQLDF